MVQVRSPGLFVVALMLLGSSGAVGLLLHDGELGTDDRALSSARPGDELRLKGDLSSLPPVPAAVGEMLGASSAWLSTGVDGLNIILSGDEVPSEGRWVVEARVLALLRAQGASWLVLEADRLTEPLLFA